MAQEQAGLRAPPISHCALPPTKAVSFPESHKGAPLKPAGASGRLWGRRALDPGSLPGRLSVFEF